MKGIIFSGLFLLSAHCGLWATEQLSSQDAQPAPCIALIRLISPGCPKGTIWIKAKIVKFLANDTFEVEDDTGKMVLFIPSDEVIASSLDLQTGMTIFANGNVDVSPVRPSKNEFYAEKILLAPKEASPQNR
jgi:hypothetical protein